MKRIVVVWALLLGFLPLAQAQGVAVSAALSLENNQLLPDEKMHLKLAIENRSGRDLKLGTTSDWLTFTVLGERNSVVMQTGTNHVYVEGEATVPAGETASREFNLTPYFDLRQPGRYTVKATIKLPEWQQEVAAEETTFTIVKGIQLASIPDLEVGVPLLQTRANQPPEIRRYRLEKSDVMAGMKLYVRLTDASGSRTLRLVPLGLYFGYSDPDVKLDRFNDLHVLHQTDAKSFTYCVIDTLGQILERHTYKYTDQRPFLRNDADGGVAVAGGARVISDSDLPPPEKQPAAPAAGASFPGSKP
ncbi:MAG: hypothetical protein ABSG04_03480 [Verrucomicrobiota bacterium]